MKNLTKFMLCFFVLTMFFQPNNSVFAKENVPNTFECNGFTRKMTSQNGFLAYSIFVTAIIVYKNSKDDME